LVDLEWPARKPGTAAVQADAACLPFETGCADAVVCNHSLEHIVELDRALVEIGRVLKQEGFLFVSVPDATTLCDRLYRWLARGGGHVNAFSSATAIAAKIESLTGLPHFGTRQLFASFSYLNRKNRKAKAPRKLLLLAGGNERFLMVGTWLLRRIDQTFGTRLTHYGWAMYFGRPGQTAPKLFGWRNVCVRCGSGHPTDELIASRLVNGRFLFVKTYRCPACGASNIFTPDTSTERRAQPS
jgi:SAM-dependent methyltransferase